MKVIVSLFKAMLLLVGGFLLLGGGACAMIDLAALGAGGGYMLVALVISLFVALVGWLMVRFALKPGKQGRPDDDNQDGTSQ